MNLTENILAVWPVATVVVRANGATEESGWYVWMLRCWSSLPEARSLPDVDQLQILCQSRRSPYRSRQRGATCLNALTHPECPPSSLTMSKSFIQFLSPYIPLMAGYFDVSPSSRRKRRSCSVSCILRSCEDEGLVLEKSEDQVFGRCGVQGTSRE